MFTLARVRRCSEAPPSDNGAREDLGGVEERGVGVANGHTREETK
jgi:hypothetical protein